MVDNLPLGQLPVRRLNLLNLHFNSSAYQYFFPFPVRIPNGL